MEPGDIIFDSDQNKYGIILKQDGCEVYECLDYDMNIFWACEEDVHKVGSADALFKALYELKSIELNNTQPKETKDICTDICEYTDCYGCQFETATKEEREKAYYKIVGKN